MLLLVWLNWLQLQIAAIYRKKGHNKSLNRTASTWRKWGGFGRIDYSGGTARPVSSDVSPKKETIMAQLGSKKKPCILRVRSEQRAQEVALLCSSHGLHYILGIEPDKPENISDIDYAIANKEKEIGPTIYEAKPSKNGPCPCGSGRKYKSCCLNKTG